MGGHIIAVGHFHVFLPQRLLLAKMSLPREDMLGFAVGSSWLVMLQDDEEEGLPDPSPGLVGSLPGSP